MAEPTTADVPPPIDDREQSIHAVVAIAGRAPSIHNTQPWEWRLSGDVLELRADRDRQLQVADRDGHSLLISCGAAAELTATALRSQGWQFGTSLLPDPDGDPELLAAFRITGRGDAEPAAVDAVAAALVRRSERRAFGVEPVDDDEIQRLRAAAAADGVYAHFPEQPDDEIKLAVAVSQADRSERDDPAYAAEMAAWVRPDTAAPDGVPATAIPHVPAGEARHVDIPLRDFEAGISGGQLVNTGLDERPLIAVILSEQDDRLQQLRAGQAMMRLMIRAELDGLASCPLSQSVDLLSFRTHLRSLMSWTGHPQIMLRIGPRPAGTPAPLTARRPVAEVLTLSGSAPPDRP